MLQPRDTDASMCLSSVSFRSFSNRNSLTIDGSIDSGALIQPALTIDDILAKLQGTGRYQTYLQTCCIILYTLGSKMLYVLPYLQLYPTLTCRASHPQSESFFVPFKDCTQEVACNPEMTSEFNVDWSRSLKNWTTELDLICAKPLAIGLMGSISFFAVAFGSLLFGG